MVKSELIAKIRTPLTAIIGSLSFVREGMCDNPTEQQEFIEQAYWSALCLLGVINDATSFNDRPPQSDDFPPGGSVPRLPLPIVPNTGAEANPDHGSSQTP